MVYIFIIRIFIQHVLSFLSTQPEITVTRLFKRLFHLTNKIPFLDVYGDRNLVGHVIKSHKDRRDITFLFSIRFI